MLFDLQTTGHHAGYIRHILRYWPDSNSRLTCVVSPEFLQKHGDVIQTKTVVTVTWLTITADELGQSTASKDSPLRLAWIEWQLFRDYAKKVNADHALVMYIDRFQLPLALRLPLPCPLSGIYFRPKFHYSTFEHHRPAKGEGLKALRERLLWQSALHHPRLKTLFCLDLLAVEPLNGLTSQSKVVHLPDPVEFYPPLPEDIFNLKSRLGIDTGRKIFLLFGSIDQRKGVYQVLAAIEKLSPSEQRTVALLLVGRVSVNEKKRLAEAIQYTEAHSVAQIIRHDEYVAEEEVPVYFALANVVLALYQQHVGSSGILLWAAATGKPVLASDYGLMGELVRRYHLGESIDSTQSDLIASKIKVLLADENGNAFDVTVQPPEPVDGDTSASTSSADEECECLSFDSKAASQFAQTNSAQQFTEVLWQNLKTEAT